MKSASWVAALMAAWAIWCGAAPALGRPGTVTVGLTPVIVNSDIALVSDWQAYLSRRLGQRVEMFQRGSYHEIMLMLINGEIEFAWICGYPYVMEEELLQLVVVPIYQGEPYYRSYLIVASDSVFASLSDLRGGIHAFSDRDSNSGHIVPRYWLHTQGSTPETYFLKHIFTNSHENVIKAVASGLTDSGNVDGYVWDVIEKTDSHLRGRTKVIRRSEKYGFPPIVALKTFPEKQASAFGAVLRNMSRDEEGRKLLARFYLDGFDAFDKSLFDGIRDMAVAMNRRASGLARK